VRPGLVERKGDEHPPRSIQHRPARVNALLGVEVPRLQQMRTLEALGFLVSGSAPEATVLAPTWRLDVSREADLAEEVGRHFGLQRIEPALPPSDRPGQLRASLRRERRLREVLTGTGLVEVVNYAFVAGAQTAAAAEDRTRLANPLTEEQDTLRTSLVMPGLLDTLRSNLRLGRRDVAVFELGRVFLRSAGAPREERRLAVLLSGSTHPHHWSMKPHPFDLFDVKGVVELLLARLGEGAPEVDRGGLPAFLHPGRVVGLKRDGQHIGYVGAVHPDVRAAWELKDEPVVLEVSLETLLDAAPPVARFSALDRYPAVERDLSIVCDETTPAAEIDAGPAAASGEPAASLDGTRATRPGKVSSTEPPLPGPARPPATRQEAVDGVVVTQRRRSRSGESRRYPEDSRPEERAGARRSG
jgi:phenylalanyl-tRNA synthetase beta chain